MYFWGLTVETVITIILVLAVGLSVDYASHIGHTFMIIPGKRHGKSPHDSDIQAKFAWKGAPEIKT